MGTEILLTSSEEGHRWLYLTKEDQLTEVEGKKEMSANYFLLTL